MIGSILTHIVEGLIRPQASVERLMARGPNVSDAALMVVASYAVQRAWVLIFLGGEVRFTLFQHLFALVGTLAYTFVTGVLIYVIGRAFGGVATREQSLVAAAWHQLVMTLLWPLLLLGIGGVELVPGQEVSSWALLVVIIFVSQWVWLLARYTATIHGFRNDWGVVGVIIGLSMLLSTLYLIVAGA